MKTLSRPALVFLLFACGTAFSVPDIYAQDGPIRQRLKERWMQRQQQKTGAETDTAAAASGETRITKPGDYRFTIQHDGLTRMYRIHVPSGYDPAKPAPLLVALHGGGGNMDYQADDSKYGLIGKSEREGFIAVFPNGFSKMQNGKLATWSAGKCCGGARDNKVDDVGFIRQMLSNITAQMNIDRNRVFATGMSNGGMMAYRLACEMSDVFTAIAAVAGTDNTSNCHPEYPVSILHIHARNDDHVLFNGGSGPGTPYKAAVTDFTSVAESVAKWHTMDHCAAAPRRIIDKAGAYCELYSPCRGGTKVQLCVTENGAHSWPGGAKPHGETPSQAISANDVMWDFFNAR